MTAFGSKTKQIKCLNIICLCANVVFRIVIIICIVFILFTISYNKLIIDQSITIIKTVGTLDFCVWS